MKTIISIVFLLSVAFFLVFTSDIEVDNYQNEESITIEIKGDIKEDTVLTVDRGTCLDDVMDKLDLNEDADLSTISINKPLKDNEIIVIPKAHEDRLISINSADLNELILLPGIGESTAFRIIEYRELNGGFKSLEELLNVKGIGDKKFAKIRELICL